MDFQELSWQARGRLWLRLLIRLTLAALFLLVVAKIGIPVLSYCIPFVMALIFAWLLEPMVRFLIRHTVLSRKAVSIIVILLICGLLGGGLFWLGFKIVAEVNNLSANWNAIWESFSAVFSQLSYQVTQTLSYLPEEMRETVESLTNQIMIWLRGLGYDLIPKGTSIAVGLPWVVLSFIFFLMASYFMMADYPRMGAVTTRWMPVNLRAFLRFLEHTFQSAFTGYIRAELLLSLVVFFILAIGFSVMKLPYALLIAFLLAVLDFIPIVGAGTIMVPWAVVSMALGNWKTAIILLAIWGVIVVFRRVAEPRFLGSQTGLHPLLALIAIYVGMKSFGVVGLIFAPTLLLVAISVCVSGVFDGFVADVSLAFQDLNAFLRHDRKERVDE